MRTQSLSKLSLPLTAILFFSLPAQSQTQSTPASESTQVSDSSPGTIQATTPKARTDLLRLIPIIGVSSYQNDTSASLNNFNEGFSAGLLADFGEGFWVFETGLMTMQSSATTDPATASLDVNTWGIPLLAKLNFSHQPHSTLFFKAGVTPFISNGDADDFDIMGSGGIGGHIQMGPNSSVVLDATYNQNITTGGELNDYTGISLLAGLAFNI